MPKDPSKLHYSRKKPKKWIWRHGIASGWSFQGSSILVLGFSRDVTYFYGIALAMSFDFPEFRTYKIWWIIYKSISSTTLLVFFFFLEQTTDRQTDLLAWVLRSPAYCNVLELLPEPPQNKICYTLHPKYVFLLFLNNLLVCDMKVFIFMK